jgi:hypothetical protein
MKVVSQLLLLLATVPFLALGKKLFVVATVVLLV